MAKMNKLDILSIILIIIGGINWGLIGFKNYNLVSSLVGTGILASAIYTFVGIAGVYSAFRFFKVFKNMDWYENIMVILLIIGAINWGFIGLVGLNLVTAIFSNALIVKIIYDAVGISAIGSCIIFLMNWLNK